MLVFGDAGAHVIGFTIELALVFFREMAVVLGHISFLVPGQTLFASFQAAGFAGRKLSALDAVCNPLLLIGFATIDLVDARVPRIDLSRTRVAGLSRG